ncbi:hypothetical protein ONE63_009577 [Megalurothrips usitatus]|uniref:Uncharacterized protein n=1 Tax=Megalurothrips usitatus TaxID=439358 RepID=A0AAV7XML6_9NEOP|nr:hypothetical protein ONE63_009577 [Megalurothrips usitatus]
MSHPLSAARWAALRRPTTQAKPIRAAEERSLLAKFQAQPADQHVPVREKRSSVHTSTQLACLLLADVEQTVK